ncbi:MAG TPA: hypothetical protein VK871_00915, partial [Candidatus Limnocylindrales bacterium]|nr:hypothetical protein [Candidatus Limnocylindrales bacterium]
ATAPDELRAIRGLVPGVAMLVPGIGSQGGDLAAVLANGPASSGEASGRPGAGLLVNVSRGIAGAAFGTGNERVRTGRPGSPGDPGEAIGAAAREWGKRLPVLR